MKLPVSLPDELLLSRLIRYVTVSGDKGDNFASKVFGSRKVSIHPFLTARLEQLAEWGYGGDLFMYTAPGVIPRTYWAGSYDREDMYFGVQLPLEEAPISVNEIGDYPSPLGWGGQAHIDEHADGSVSVMWRVRLLDYNQVTGEITAEQSEFVYEVE